MIVNLTVLLKTPQLSIVFVKGKRKRQWLHVIIPIVLWSGSILSVLALSKARWFCMDCASSQDIQPTSNAHKRKVMSTSSSLKHTRTDSEAIVRPCDVNVRAHKRSCSLNPSQRGEDNQVKCSDGSDVQVTGESETNPV